MGGVRSRVRPAGWNAPRVRGKVGDFDARMPRRHHSLTRVSHPSRSDFGQPRTIQITATQEALITLADFKYAVPLEGMAVYHVCANPKNDVVVAADGKTFAGSQHSVVSLRLLKEIGGFLVREVAFERGPAATPAITIVVTRTGLADVIGRGSFLSARPLCKAAVCGVPIDVPPPQRTPELARVARDFFKSDGTLFLSVNGKRLSLYLPKAREIPPGSRIWKTDIETTVAVSYILEASKSFDRWRIDPTLI